MDATEPFTAVIAAWERIGRGVIQPEDFCSVVAAEGWLLELVSTGPGPWSSALPRVFFHYGKARKKKAVNHSSADIG